MHRDPVRERKNIRRRVGSLDEGHARVAPYAHQVRLVLKNDDDLQLFCRMCSKAEIQIPNQLPHGEIDVQRLGIFSSVNLAKVFNWIAKLPWPVAFQCEALLRNLRLNVLELLTLRTQIEGLAGLEAQYASQVLRHFHTVLPSLRRDETYLTAFDRAVQEYDQLLGVNKLELGAKYYYAHHVSFTPSAIRLEGPYLHQSNRVVGPSHHYPILPLNKYLCFRSGCILITKNSSSELLSVMKIVYSTVGIEWSMARPSYVSELATSFTTASQSRAANLTSWDTANLSFARILYSQCLLSITPKKGWLLHKRFERKSGYLMISLTFPHSMLLGFLKHSAVQKIPSGFVPISGMRWMM